MTAAQFRKWRQSLELTQAEAAEALGLSVSSISDYERGKKRGTDRAARVPQAVALACEALTGRYRKAGRSTS
jgi:predicted transcriptional regulator